MKTTMAVLLLALLGGTPVAGDIVRLSPADGDALLAKRFSVPANTTIFGVAFTSSDVSGVFTEIGLVQGAATDLATAERLASRGDVRPDGDGGVSCRWTTTVSSGDRGSEYLVVVRLPAGANGRKPGVGATAMAEPSGSYLACARDGELILFGADFDMELITDRQSGKSSNRGVQPEPTREAAHAAYLGVAVPNPANATSKIEFGVAEASNVELSLYDVGGRRVRTLARETLNPGVYSRDWDGLDDAGRRVAAGIYFMKLRVGARTLTEKLIITK